MVRSAQAGLLAVAVLIACTRGSSLPGEPLGTFLFDATPLTLGCPFQELPDGGFGFTGIFSAVDGGPEAYLTVNDVRRQGMFDGQRFESIYPAPSDPAVPRTFELDCDAGVLPDGTACDPACGNRFLIEETLRAVFLTAEQSAVVASCPDDPEVFFDAGVTDAGILPPSRGPDGFDAARACGVLIENIQPAEVCDFQACMLTYRVDGKRTE